MNATPPSVVERLLAERIGLDPSSVGDKLIARGVHVRMMALGSRSRAEYDRVLLDQAGELQALVEEIVVAESWFFRDEQPFEVLQRHASEGWLIDPARPPLTALSIPCASGEEPYSIALTLLEAGLAADRFRVDAVDVSSRSIARAIAGVYGPNAFRGKASTRRSAYFREQNGSFTLDLAVRSTVRFRLGNLLDATLFDDREPFDVVFCRNLLIYLDDDAKTRAFASLTRLVADDGLLFLGHADRLESLDGTPFELMREKGSFGYRKINPADRKPPEPPPIKTIAATPTAPSPRQLARPAKHAKVVRPAIAPTPRPAPVPQPAPPSPVVGEPVEPWLDRASAMADSGGYVEARALVEQAIAAGRGEARAYFLLGMIAQAVGPREQAEAHYLKAIYLDPQHDEALLALALLARRKGDVAAEAGYRRRAERVLARKVSR
jgi:chemotaxis protein methyltransferase WspC